MNPRKDTDAYRYKYLKLEDQIAVNDIDVTFDACLANDAIDEFVAESGYGRISNQLLKEILISFTSYVRMRVDYCIADLIINCIDNYSDEEYKQLVEKADVKERKGA